jgi:hypothetical protein
MRLSPDEMIFWQYGFIKLNATIVFTWGLMLVLAVGSHTHHAQAVQGSETFRWQNLLEIVVTGIEKQIAEVGLRQPRSISAFWARCFCSSPRPASAPSFPATSRRPARSRPRRRWRCACWWPCRSSASRSKGWAAISSPT